jgi:hypothetical protein
MQSKTCKAIWTNFNNPQHLHRCLESVRHISQGAQQQVWESEWIYHKITAKAQTLLLDNCELSKNLRCHWNWLIGIW